jgi:hypothetical protein
MKFASCDLLTWVKWAWHAGELGSSRECWKTLKTRWKTMTISLARLMGSAGCAAVTVLLATMANASSLAWVKITPAQSPSARAGFAMAYDPVSRKIVLFGGSNATNYFGDTWTFDGTTWTREITQVSPSPRASAMLAYDVPTRKLVLFGGFNDPDFLGDTWLWDGATSTWTQANPRSGPGPLAGAILFTDPKVGHAGLFGGRDPMIFHADTWRWNGVDWQLLQPTARPSSRGWAAAGVDLARKNVVMSGGTSEMNTEDTWTWDGTNWTQQFPATQMPYVFYTSCAFDPLLRQLIVFGGDEVSGAENASWAWTGENWVQLQPLQSPPARDSMGMAYDFSNHEQIMFGGVGLKGLYNDTWKLITR